MLSKLIKYDIRSTWRDFAGVYLSILLGVIIVPLIFNNVSNPIVNTAAGFIATSIVIATIVIMIINLFKIFNTNVFSKEGYLTMTLPVTSKQIVFSKLLVSTMWIVLTGLVSAIGMLIFMLMFNSINLPDLTYAIQRIMAFLDGNSILVILLMIIAVVISIVKEIAKIFLACSIAHIKHLNRMRVPLGIISYFVFSWAETLIVQVLGIITSFVPYFTELGRQLEAISNPEEIHKYMGLFSGVIGVGILYALILTTVYSLGTIWILNHKLDLD